MLNLVKSDADPSVEDVAQFLLLPHVFSLRRRQLLVDLALLEHDLGAIEQLEAMSTPVVEQSVAPPAIVLVQQGPLLMLHLVANSGVSCLDESISVCHIWSVTGECSRTGREGLSRLILWFRLLCQKQLIQTASLWGLGWRLFLLDGLA